MCLFLKLINIKSTLGMSLALRQFSINLVEVHLLKYIYCQKIVHGNRNCGSCYYPK